MRPLGVVGCLTAGFDLVGRYPWLISLPVLLDLFLWLGPRLSIAPLLNRFIDLLQVQSIPDAAMTSQIAEVGQFLRQFGEQFNLLSLLSSLPLLDVPSLLARHAPEGVSPLGEPHVLVVTSVLMMIVWAVALALVGLVFGFLYLNGLANRVRDTHLPAKQGPAQGSKAKEPEQTVEARSGMWKFVRVFLFAAGLLVAGMVTIPPLVLAVGIVETIAPGTGFWLLMFSMGLIVYLAMQLLFVIPGVMVGERGLWRATWESIGLIRMQSFPVMGLIVLVMIIHGGLTYIWLLPSADSWTLLIGIVGHSCIATGLMAAGFVFYQERVGQLTEAIRVAAKSGVKNGKERPSS